MKLLVVFVLVQTAFGQIAADPKPDAAMRPVLRSLAIPDGTVRHPPGAAFSTATAREPSCLRAVSVRPSQPGRTLWAISLAALASANLADIHSSWGKHESNQVLAGAEGTFGARGAAIKAGLGSIVCLAEYVILRRHASAARHEIFTRINFAAAGTLGGIAAHNYLHSDAR